MKDKSEEYFLDGRFEPGNTALGWNNYTLANFLKQENHGNKK